MVHHQKQVERGGPGEGTAKVGGWSSASRAARDAVVGSTDRVGTLVLDAAPFLNGVKLDYLPADGFVTTPEVLKEIRDRQAREQLGRLTVDLKVQMPSADSLKAVAAFTAKTGDSAALSATDLRVIALAYTLEVEAKGCSCHLRTEPLRPVVGTPPSATWSSPQRSCAKCVSRLTERNPTGGATRSPPSSSATSKESRETTDRSGRAADAEPMRADRFQVATTSQRLASDLPVGGDADRKGTTEAAEAEDKENAGPDLPAGGDEERDSVSDAAVAEGQRRLDVAPDLPVGGDEERKSANGAAEGEDRKHLDVASDLPVGGDEERKSANGAAEAEDRKRLDVVSDLPVGGDEGRENANGAAEAEGGNSLSAAMSLLRVAGGDEASRPTIRNTSGDEKGAEASQLGGEDGLDEDGWVTPDNIHVVRNKAFGVTAERRKPMEIPVACMSSDFAVQNVLMQMGIKLLSVDGKVLRSVKSWVLRCHACFKITKVMDKQFCPSCGSPTLTRVSCATDARGGLRIFLKRNYTYNLRGTQYSLPLPRGGRNAANPILREDQKEYERAVRSQRRRKEVDVFDPDYVFDMLAGGAKKKADPAAEIVIGAGRRNPNVVKRTGRKKR